jgi:hypothetical protein
MTFRRNATTLSSDVDQRRPAVTHALRGQERIECADSLAEVLDAAYVAFGEMLAVIRRYEESGAAFHAALVMATAAAADGRDAVAGGQSLPPRGSHDQQGRSMASVSPSQAAAFVASLSQTVATRLRRAVGMAKARADREACDDGARYADEMHSLVSGDWP